MPVIKKLPFNIEDVTDPKLPVVDNVGHLLESIFETTEIDYYSAAHHVCNYIMNKY